MRTSLPALNVRREVVSRRAALTRLGAILLGAAAATGCAPSFIARALYPEVDELDERTIARTLRAFVATVIPEAEEPERVARVFADPTFRFVAYRRALVADLRRRALQLSGATPFDRLGPAERTKVVVQGLAAGAVAGRLYNGGVFLTQVIYFGGFWNAAGACPLIGFEGPNHVADPPALTYPDPETYFAAAITADGNPA